MKLTSGDRPIVAMCAGKDCRKRCEYSKMRRALEDGCTIIELKCVGICEGPVVVVCAGSDNAAVFAKVRSKKQRDDVVVSAMGRRRPSRKLAELEVSSKDRREALRKVRRAIA